MSVPTTTNQIAPAFTDPVRQAQSSFRGILAAMAEPGTIHDVGAGIHPPSGFHAATTAVLLTLADRDTRVWIDPTLGNDASAYLRFHTGAPTADSRETSQLAAVGGRYTGFDAFNAGSDSFPDASTTVVVQCASLIGGAPIALSGPGINGQRMISPAGVHAGFWDEIAQNSKAYPRGVDVLLVAHSTLIGLPRSTRVTSSGVV
jgi:alpha-D-ribose 1-methylphosphonate 5-triphosphate synthase subunit PhnH